MRAKSRREPLLLCMFCVATQACRGIDSDILGVRVAWHEFALRVEDSRHTDAGASPESDAKDLKFEVRNDGGSLSVVEPELDENGVFRLAVGRETDLFIRQLHLNTQLVVRERDLLLQPRVIGHS